MTLLDRFRTQSRDKHPDVAVRLEYVEDLPLADRQAIAAMAREDDDPRVRRAAVAKLMDPTALGAIAREDRDLDVRSQASAMLRDIALEAFEGVSEGDGLEAVDAVSDPRVLAQIAKASNREIVALRAVSRVSDAHVLGSIARHAVSEAARRNAFASLLASGGDRAEILAIALNSEHKDTAVAAVDRFVDRDDLEQIAARSRHKSAAKRARTLLREADEASGRAAAAAAQTPVVSQPAPAPGEEADVPEDVEQFEGVEDVDATAGAGVEALREADEEEKTRERHEREAAEQAQTEAAAEAARKLDEDRRARLAELAAAAEVASAQTDLAASRKHMNFVRREWHQLAASVIAGDDLAALTARFTEADARVAARETEAREADARARREALARVQLLLARVESLAARPDLTLKAADRAMKELRAVLGTVPPLPSKQDFEEVTRRLKAAQGALGPKLQELRDADDWQRFANVTIQEQLCARMEALKSEEDPDVISRQVRDLQQQWRQAADVPRAQADALWRRFKTAHDEVWAKCEAHFVAQGQARAENLARKAALCERAESLAGSSNWLQTAEEIKQLQAEWKTIGPVSRGREKAIWERFRAACDQFFTRRHEDLAQRKGLWAENLAKKDALCVKVEALADSTDWEPAAAEIRRLQSDWKSIGPVKKSRSEAIWQRFRGACDRFFARYAQRHDTARAERVAAREAICAELESLAAPDLTDAPPNLPATVRGLRATWQSELAARGVDPDRARALDERFAQAFAQVQARWPAAFAGTDLDPDANRKRMEAVVLKMEELAVSLAGPLPAADAALSPANRLAAMLKEALAANTIGGKVSDDARFRAALEEVRQAQATWSRIGPVPDVARRPLVDRFQKATRRISERAGQVVAAGGAGRAGTAGRAERSGRPGGSDR